MRKENYVTVSCRNRKYKILVKDIKTVFRIGRKDLPPLPCFSFVKNDPQGTLTYSICKNKS